jgi:cytochrome b
MSEHDQKTKPALIWDLPLRVFHWSLAACVLGCFGTAEFGWLSMQWHFYFGYAILVLLAFRLLWGFVGTEHSRFANFLTGPKKLIAYLQQGTTGPGHTPLGALATLALLVAVGVQALSGLFNSDEIQWYGPLSEKVSMDVVEWAADIHERLDKVVIALIVLHLCAIAFYALIKRQNLIAPMLHGYKKLSGENGIVSQKLMLAVLMLAIAAAVVWAGIAYFPGEVRENYY